MYNLHPLASGERSDPKPAPALMSGGEGPRDRDPAPGRWTLLDVLRWTTSRFQQRQLPSPRLDAEILIAAALGTSRVQLYVQFERPLGPDELATIRELVRRRQNGESVAYVVGKKEFFGLELAVDARVLVPRPDTETLVDEALARWRERTEPSAGTPQGGDDAPTAEPGVEMPGEGEGEGEGEGKRTIQPRVADVGTGSGAIILAIGKQLRGAALFAVDVSAGALAVARANGERHAIAVTWLEGDLAQPLAAHGPFDLVVANLPYIPTMDIPSLPPDVRAEPHLALDGGSDGLALVRRLVATAQPLLAPGGALVLEIGFGQAAATRQLLVEAGLTDLRVRRDLGGVDRVVSARMPAGTPAEPPSAQTGVQEGAQEGAQA
jgi:release factor glutamine methyltransferase